MVFTIPLLPPASRRVADVLTKYLHPPRLELLQDRSLISHHPVFFESETKKDLSDIQERHIRHPKRGQFFWLPRTVRVIRG